MNSPGIRRSNFSYSFSRINLQRGLTFGVIIVAALIAFEIFNYSTTEYALADLLGDLEFMGLRWSTILSLAFCGIDFAGIARLFTPEDGMDEPTEVWYLFGAWLLAATMNAMLTWWGISLAILNHQSLGNAVVERDILLRAVPIFVAVLVWLIRVLIIGTFSVAGERLFTQSERRYPVTRDLPARPLNSRLAPPAPSHSQVVPSQRPAAHPNGTYRPAPKPVSQPEPSYSNPRPEPTYHPVSMSPPLAPGKSRQTRR